MLGGKRPKGLNEKLLAVAVDSFSSTERTTVPSLFRGRSAAGAVVKVAWPSVATGLLRTALGQIDAYQIGRLGTVELQAISAASFAVWLVYILGELASVGVHALSSEAEGAGKREIIGEEIAQGAYFAILASVFAYFLSGAGFLRRYFAVVGVRDPRVALAGASYLRVTAAYGCLPLSLSCVATAGFKGIGETRAALAIAGATVFMNAALNSYFIGLWGVPGAAWATNLSALVAFFASLIVLRQRHDVRVPFLTFPKVKKIFRIFSIGFPLASSGALFSLVYVWLGAIVASVDPLFLAALGVAHRIEAVAYTICEGYAVGAATCVGQWLGANDTKKARGAAAAAAKVSLITIVPVALLTFLFAPKAAAVFVSDPLIVAVAVDYLRIVSLVFPLMAIEAAYEGALLGAQRTAPAFFVTLLGSGLRIPIALALLPNLGVNGVWTAIALTTLFKAPAKYLAFKHLSLGGTTTANHAAAWDSSSNGSSSISKT